MAPRLSIEEKEKVITTRCNVCREVFKPVNLSKTCPKCVKDDEDLGKALRNYITSHQGIRVDEICEVFHITQKEVREYEKRGFFEFVTNKSMLR